MPRLSLLRFAAFLPLALSAADIAAVKEAGVGTNGFRSLVAADRTTAPLLAPASGEGEARIPPFDAVAIDVGALWDIKPTTPPLP